MKTATKLTDKNMTKKQLEEQDIFMNIFAEVFGSKK